MKTAILFALLTFASPLIPAIRAQDPNDRVSVSARSQIDADLKNIKGSREHTHIQKVTLTISLSGRPKSPENRTVTWFVFGRDVKSNKVTIVGTGDETLALGGVGRQTIETRAASTTYTPDHSVVEQANGGNKKKKGGKKQSPRVRRVQGTGVRYIGYGVLVKEGGDVVGKIFMSPGLEAEVK